MGFPERAVEACLRDWSAGKVDESHIRDVLKSKKVDVAGLEVFLGQEHPHEVRWAAARVLSEKGQIAEVVKAALLSQDRETFLEMLSLIGRQDAGLEALENLVSSSDLLVRDAAVDMFRRAGKTDVLFPLVFDQDDNVVKRIKRYIDEAGQRGKTCGS